MGSFLEKPKVEKHSESGRTTSGIRFALSSMQGWRVEMEDAHTALCSVQGFPTWSFFGVYDGHAGAGVSARCSTNLLPAILENIARIKDMNEDYGETGPLSNAIRSGFLQLDESMRTLPEVMAGQDRSGSTAICCLVTKKHLYFANCGDSRAVLSRGGKVALCTHDHKPANPAERDRIQKAGGSVMIQRVNGSLAVSRALGDYEYKANSERGPCEQLVSPEPEVTALDKSDNDEFAVLACDGVWDVMTNEEVCDFVRHELRTNPDLEAICSHLVDVCLFKGSRDNMSVVLIVFPGAPGLDEKLVQELKEIDAYIKDKVKNIYNSGTTELSDVLLALAEDSKVMDSLPSGVGIHAKRSLVEAELRQLNPNKEQRQDNNC
ncbi:protein phosphatase 1A-like [Varroa jacobsoni]|uniref:PPM-type phosphatase domain-containing protein n=1 Tax=Varroa destructor TaxID=109461 RepID=A0A7M7JDL1_VARDE|nr:protein phosphatase 1A-like [Varroa destructor]XP_022650294.1 protein phosphatase 1A-like [Varroa destructor]XP_022650295.1 protein phosphatase 1A-like [Varroa destructor]XP_022650296.1 protein phosphatase 1A-like [Varroa destructor]XP_022650297.1 protein phosphatase 1A-like [Varroa destructor]XP_022650298.1 protein phosphatase 1A-like [Varroa destructor]XP_022650300.1 protein phosphatase 1A-like [Varroa destructor]XP_022650301.1 protein phosphatase 1A-like [Varroa destructor]XP_02270814